MFSRLLLFSFFAYFILFDNLQAQDNLLHCPDTSYCAPQIEGLPRSKGIVAEYEQVLSYNIKATSDNPNIGNSNEVKVNGHQRIQYKIKLPLMNTESMKIIMGFQYFVEQFEFEKAQNSDYSLFRSLEDRNLRSIGLSTYLVKSFRGDNYAMLRLRGSLNGDYGRDISPASDYVKFSITPLYGWKKSSKLSYGIGLSYGYTFGRATIIPIFAYNRTFNERWGLEATLPASIRLRWNLSEKDLLYLTAKVAGSSYRIRFADSSVFGEYETLELQRSEVKFFLNYDREIYDFIWFGVSAGIRQNVNFRLREDPTRRATTLIEGNFDPAPFVNVSLFLVPPRKFVN